MSLFTSASRVPHRRPSRLDALNAVSCSLGRRLISALLLGVLIPLLHVASGRAAGPDHAIVPTFERFHAGGEPSDAQLADGGRLLLGELNCLACHAADAPLAAALLPKQAPLLGKVGERVRPEYLRALLMNPQQVKPGTTMPALLSHLPAAEREAKADALVHFLVGDAVLAEANAVSQSVKRGETLFHQVGCAACHDRQDGKSPPQPDSMPLASLSAKYSLPSLQTFLAEPLAVRPSGRMPHLNLTPEESRDIASYLLRDLAVAPNMKYAYYEGNWDKLPDFAALKPKSSGVTSGFSLQFGRNDQFALRFEGYLQIAKEGQYRLFLGSDDGSRVLVDGNELVRVDGVHPYQEGVGRVFLTRGAHKIEVEYFEGGGEEVLRLEIDGGGLKRQAVDFMITLDATPPADAGKPRFTVDSQKAAEGKTLFTELGCASCHALNSNATAKATRPAPALAGVNAARGCLAPDSSSTPRYALSQRQKEALQAALAAAKTPDAAPLSAAPSSVVDRTLVAFNCYACHVRGTQGGVTEARNVSFQSNQPEMGDEGRIPPQLTGVGGKLKREWLAHLLNNGAKDRPYMFTRMPKFGAANVGHLVAALEQADPEPAYARVELGTSLGAFKAVGRKLVGAQGYSCIKCHTWGAVPATGIQSISMTTMTKRLRESWFHAYVLDPPAFRPGTRMPSAWPQGQTLLPALLDGDSSKQIHSVWQFLLDGEKAALPLGLGRDPIELVAGDAPVIYRNFIEGAGPRAIGVGYPQKINLAFDANDLRIALLWQGSFIDASKHWTDRGVGFQSPLGDNVFATPAGVDFARLENAEAPWPKLGARALGYRFRGYRLNAQQEPVFAYELGDGIQVTDYPRPAGKSDQGVLLRTLSLVGGGDAGGQVWFRAAEGAKIEPVEGGGFRVDDHWQVRVTAGDAQPQIRQQGGRRQLVVPLRVGKQPINVTQEIRW
ncbi:MAG: c-type cytochrome [Pirellulales bacterium]